MNKEKLITLPVEDLIKLLTIQQKRAAAVSDLMRDILTDKATTTQELKAAEECISAINKELTGVIIQLENMETVKGKITRIEPVPPADATT